MKILTINIIGAGRLGKTIGRLLHQQQLASVKGILNARLQQAKEAVAFIGEGVAVPDYDELPLADMIFITTPDDCIANVAKKLIQAKKIKPQGMVIHCSGSLPASILNDAKTVPAYVASLHPLHSFADPNLSIQTFHGTYCALEGDEEATTYLTSLFTQLGAKVFSIRGHDKSCYHAAGVFASNYLTTLYAHALDCLAQADIPQLLAHKITIKLMEDTLRNLKQSADPKKSLTGPIERGDYQTLSKHLQGLKNVEAKRIYQCLGEASLALTKHDHKTQKMIRQLLCDDSATT